MKPRPLSNFAQNRYLTYPHSNGFADGGASLVLGQIEEKTVSLWKLGLASGREVRLGNFPVDRQPPHRLLWFDVAFDTNQMIVVAGPSLWHFELSNPGPAREVYHAPAPWRLNEIPSITADGGQAVVGLHDDKAGRHRALHLDLRTGAERVLFEHTWLANHFHFSPFDSSWIGYCHEGLATDIFDRVWAWHAEEAPRGRCLFDQRTGDGKQLCLGHEHWSFHATSVVVPAYGISPSEPRGLYELFPGDREARLISSGERDWHCGVSRDGRWAVVDTTGPHDAPGCGWEGAGDISDILLVDMRTGQREFVARARQHRFHPRHPHPVFSPDGATIFCNEAEPDDGANNRVISVANPCIN